MTQPPNPCGAWHYILPDCFMVIVFLPLWNERAGRARLLALT